MRCLAVVVLVAASSVAAAAPHYPAPFVTASRADRDRRVAELVRREPIAWLTIDTDARGFVTHVVTEDRTIVPASTGKLEATDLGRVRALLLRDADLFGIDPAALGTFQVTGSCAARIDHEVENVSLGRVVMACEPAASGVRLSIEITPWLDLAPRLDSDQAARQVLGARYLETWDTRIVPPRDCHAGERCGHARVQRSRSVVELSWDELSVTSIAIVDRGRIRVVHCFDTTWTLPRGAPMSPSRSRLISVVPLRGAPVPPIVIDAVTGQRLPLHPRTCAALQPVP